MQSLTCYGLLLQGDAERLKTLITEPTARFEAKYQSPLTLPSFHNFVVLSNNDKAVLVGQSERRFFMLQPKRKQYSKPQWTDMWYQVKDPAFQELFFQHLLSIDTSVIIKGQAPMTTFKQVIQSEQAPPTITFLKELLHDPCLMQRPMENMSDGFRMQLLDEFSTQKRFALKHREPLSEAFQNLLEPSSDEHLLNKDMDRSSAVKTQVPQKHVKDCISHYFKGESYIKIISSDINKEFLKLGFKRSCMIMRDPTKGGEEVQYKSWAFPSIEGLRFMLAQHHWMTAEDDDVAPE